MSIRALSIVLCATLVLADLELPSSIKTCKRDADDYSSCLRLAIQESWPTFVQGLPDFEMPALDPYFTEYYESSYQNGQMVGTIIAKDVNTYGLTKARFLSVKPTVSDDFFRLEIDVELPKILIEGDYKAEGSLGTFKIGGKGYFNISMEDIRSVWDIEGPVQNDKWIVQHFRVAPEVGTMKVYFTDLFNGNQEMNQMAMAFVNEYWPTIYRGMMPYLIELWDKHLTEMVNNFFSKVSFSKVFP